jgi:hypothetical protein
MLETGTLLLAVTLHEKGRSCELDQDRESGVIVWTYLGS